MAQLFPSDFLWGAATSAHQVEGNNHNDWTAAEAAGRVPPAGIACDSYNRYEEDFDLAVALGHNAHRLSLEWSRLEPAPGHYDMAEVAHYRKVLQALKDRHLTSFVTLWHFTLPVWAVGIKYQVSGIKYDNDNKNPTDILNTGLHGWEDPRVVDRFIEYAKFCAQNFGDLVDFWITQNEPTQVYGTLGYLTGQWPPFKKLALWSYLKVCWHLGQAHNKAYDAIKKVVPNSQVGIVENFSWTDPLRHPERHVKDLDSSPGAQNDGFIVDQFLASLINFFNHKVSLILVKQHLDFLGVNHYFHHRIHFSFKDGLQYGEKIDDKLWVSDLGWTLYPRAIYEVLKSVKIRIKSVKIAVYITENGLADAADVSRQKFIAETLQWVKQALDEGVDVRGYLHWSLLDNYEWAEGYKAKFGLVTVDFNHGQTRQIRPSARGFRDFIHSSVLSSQTPRSGIQ